MRCWSTVVVFAVVVGAIPIPVAAAPRTVVGRVDVHAGVTAADSVPRSLFVAVPAGYDSTLRYPVLYLHDGQDLFDAALAAGGEEWGVDELLAARPAGIPPLLVVGIAAAPNARHDYAPPGSAAGARGDAYARFVVEVVKPFVDARYSTRAASEWTWIGGAGAGGVAALYAAWMHADVFGAGIALALPDLEPGSVAWVRETTPAPGLRLWIEHAGGSESLRTSTTQLLTDLRRAARVDLRIAGRDAVQLVRLAAALRAVAGP